MFLEGVVNRDNLHSQTLSLAECRYDIPEETRRSSDRRGLCWRRVVDCSLKEIHLTKTIYFIGPVWSPG